MASEATQYRDSFAGWERYPLRPKFDPYPWSIKLTDFQSKYITEHDDDGYSYSATGLTCVDVVIIGRTSSPMMMDEIRKWPHLPVIRTFDSEPELLEYIDAIDTDSQSALIFIRSDTPEDEHERQAGSRDPAYRQHPSGESPGNPCITPSSIFKICTKFDIQPSLLVSLGKDPHFSTHCAEGNPDETDECHFHDLSYHLPLPWFMKPNNSSEGAYSPISQYGVSVYARYRHDGQPMVSIYTNFRRLWIREVVNAWKISVLQVTHPRRVCLADHWTFLNINLSRAFEKSRFHDALYDLTFSNSVASHLGGETSEGVWGTIPITLQKCGSVVNSTEAMVLPLEAICKAILKLSVFQKRTCPPQMASGDKRKNIEAEQEHCLSSSLLNAFELLKKRNKILLKRSERNLAQLFNVIRLQDSEAMAKHTAYLASLADVQQESNLEIHRFTWESRQDARLMKFLAEVTMVFFPITAVAAVFSMPFFQVDTVSPAFLPLSSIRHIWVFVLAAGIISSVTWIIWFQHRKKLEQDARVFQSQLADEEKRRRQRTKIASLRTSDPLSPE
ncbi:hypothetical protein AA313_de0203170 [Arthrobotrys entomopaga]|nr:hypothetical protein AA313_de0203170 [Arthrobotrys entomopaga]